MAISILFNQINVAGQQRNGTVSVGEVLQSGWSAHAKQNLGQGMLSGINNTAGFFSNIIDPDVIDSPILDNDAPMAAQGQAV